MKLEHHQQRSWLRCPFGVKTVFFMEEPLCYHINQYALISCDCSIHAVKICVVLTLEVKEAIT